MHPTLGTLPTNSDLKRQLRIPTNIFVSPVETNFATSIQSLSINNLIKCSHCSSYLSSFCEIDNNMWKCSICGCSNSFTPTDISEAQISSPNIEIPIEPANIKVLPIFFLSTNFPEPAFTRAKICLISMLRESLQSPDSKALIFIGSDSSPFSVLIPSRTTIFAPSLPHADSFGSFDSFSNPSIFNFLSQSSSKQPNSCASLSTFSSIEAFLGLDLANFFFTPETEASAERAIEILPAGPMKDPLTKSWELSGTLSRVMERLPLRFISLINEINHSILFDPLRGSLLRLDYILSQPNKYSTELANANQGAVYFLAKQNPLAQGRHIINEKTAYQLIVKANCRKAGIEWKKQPKPFIDIQENSLFSPVCISEHQSYVLDLSQIIKSQDGDKLGLQFVVKYIGEHGFVMRIFNQQYKMSSDCNEIFNSADWNAIIMSWTRSLCTKYRGEATSSIIRAAAYVLAEQFKRTNDMDEGLIKGVCSMPNSDVFSDDWYRKTLGSNLLVASSPETLKMIPEIERDDDGNEYCISADGIEGSGKKLKEIQKHLQMYTDIVPDIQSYHIRPPENIFNQLQSLIEKMTSV